MDAEIETADGLLTALHELVAQESHVEIQIFVRSLSPPLGAREQQERLLRQVRQLQRSGVVDDYSVNIWGEGNCLCEVCSEANGAEAVLGRVEEFQVWADKHDLTLPFERRRVESKLLDTTVSDLSVPSICLAIYTESELCGVLPCTVEDEHISVTEYVEVLVGEYATDAESAGRDTAAQT